IVWPRPLSSARRHRAGVRRGRLVNLTGTTGALLDAYNRHDVETVASLYTADGTHEDMAPNKSKVGAAAIAAGLSTFRSEEHTSELQSLMRISYAVYCLKK